MRVTPAVHCRPQFVSRLCISMVKIAHSVHISRRKDEPYALFGWGDLTGAIPFRLTRFTRCSLSFMLHGQWHLSGSTPSPVRTTCVVHVFQGGKHDTRHSVAGLRLRVHHGLPIPFHSETIRNSLIPLRSASGCRSKGIIDPFGGRAGLLPPERPIRDKGEFEVPSGP